jgi:eukaryotic-like serine/threonine-protein kinase
MSAPPNPSPERIPARIGRYEILLPIGTGGMATVYVARTEVVDGMHRFVALKMMHPQMNAGDGDAARQLIEEAKLAASIRHPNVVAVHEAARDPSGVYMVMDYVEGDTLSGLIRGARARREQLPLPVVGRILADALSGLHAAHELSDASGRPVNLVHRDYSPSNILVGVDGVTRLADFGVAKAESRLSATTSGAIKGKIGYMAPEQILAKRLDRRCDVWAAGVIAWECLAGQRLFRIHQDEEQVATLFRIVQEEPPLLATVRPDLPDELGAAIATALTRDVESRCPTAAELRRELMRAWRAIGPIAETAEVGEYVVRLAGDQLEERRRKTTRVLELRGQLATVSRAASAVVHGSATGFSPVSPVSPPARPPAETELATVAVPARRVAAPVHLGEDPTEREATAAVAAVSLPSGQSAPTTAAAPSAPEPRVRRVSWPYRLAAVAATALFAGGAWEVGAARPRGEHADAAAPPIHSAAALAAASTSAPSPAPSSGPPLLTVRASAAIASLRVGERVIAMAPPAREVEVRLSDAERDSTLRIEAATADGQRASTQLAPGIPSVDLVFAAAPRPSIAPPRRAPPPADRPDRRAQSSADGPPRLAPSPFGNR